MCGVSEGGDTTQVLCTYLAAHSVVYELYVISVPGREAVHHTLLIIAPPEVHEETILSEDLIHIS